MSLMDELSALQKDPETEEFVKNVVEEINALISRHLPEATPSAFHINRATALAISLDMVAQHLHGYAKTLFLAVRSLEEIDSTTPN